MSETYCSPVFTCGEDLDKALKAALCSCDDADRAAAAATKSEEIRDELLKLKDDGDLEGTTYTPSVSAEGVLSWSNDGGLPNPDPVNITGPTGAAGKNGTSVTITKVTESSADGGSNVVTFSDGKTLSVKNGSKGSDGKEGADGTSVTVTNVSESTSNGGNNVVTFSDGTTLTVKNGTKGTKGATGAAGTSVTITDITESTADGGTSVVTFSDGNTLSIKNGSKGSTGAAGTSVTHSWNGTTLSVTSASGTTSANLKGAKGDDGSPGVPAIVKSITKNGLVTTVVLEDFNGETEFQISDGAAGKDGTSVAVSKTTTSSADGGNNVVTFTDGKTLTVKNGTKGSSGKDGTSVTITNVTESTASGGSNIVTFSDGKTLTIKNGKDGTGGGGNGSADWSVNDPDASGYVKNRTHWSEGASEVLLVSGKQVTADNGYISDTELLTVGTEYRVLYDGTEYHFTASEYTDNAGRKYVYCGNSVILSGNYDDSIWDDWFVIFNFNGKTFVKDVMIEKGLSTSATISMHGIIETVHKLDEKYIPDTIARKSDITGGGGVQADWNQMDETAADFIKNKPFYDELVDTLPEAQYELGFFEDLGGYVAMLPIDSQLIDGDDYVVVYNGTAYNCVVQMGALGNIGLMTGGNDTGEPFIIVVQSGDDGMMGMLLDLQGNTNVTMSMSKRQTIPIASKYIPKSPVLDLTEIGFPTITDTETAQQDFDDFTVYMMIRSLLCGDFVRVKFDFIGGLKEPWSDGSSSILTYHEPIQLEIPMTISVEESGDYPKYWLVGDRGASRIFIHITTGLMWAKVRHTEFVALG